MTVPEPEEIVATAGATTAGPTGGEGPGPGAGAVGSPESGTEVGIDGLPWWPPDRTILRPPQPPQPPQPPDRAPVPTSGWRWCRR